MLAFIRASWRYALLSAGLFVVLGLSLYAGAVVGNGLMGQPQLGAAFGGAACCVALVYRVRSRVTRADLYYAAIESRSPYASLPLLAFFVFCIMCASGAVAGVAGSYIDTGQTFNAMLFGAALGLGLTLNHALTMPQQADADHEDVFDNMRPATLQEALDGGLSTDWENGLFVGVWKEPIKSRFGRTRYKTYLLSTASETSALLIAPPGAGKFINAVVSTALANSKDHQIYHDPKPEISHVAIPALRARGFRVAILDHMNTLGGKFGPSDSINPLGDLDISSLQIEELIAILIAIIIVKNVGEKNPFFSVTSRQLGAAVALHLLETVGKAATLPMVVDVLFSEFELNKACKAMQGSKFSTVRHVGNQWHMPPDDKGKLILRNEALQNVLLTARSEIAFLGGAGMRRLFGSGSFSFSYMKRTDEKWALFNVCPEAGAKATEKANQLIFASAKNGLVCLPKVGVLCVIDELCTAMDSSAALLVQEMFNLGRGAGVRVIGVAQSWPQFEVWAGGEKQAAAIRAAAGAFIAYGANDLVTAEQIRREAGTYTIWQPSTDMRAIPGVEGGSTHPMAQPLLRDSDLREMLKDGCQVIMLAKCRMPVIMPRTPYFKIPVLAKRAAENPFFTK